MDKQTEKELEDLNAIRGRPEFQKCVHCGHMGSDVSIHQNWVGGQGYVDFIECDQRENCWKRMEKLVKGV